MERQMETLKIYKITDRYVRYLHQRDSRVQYNKDATRPYVGIVYTIGKYRYFVPMESPKPNHANIKAGKHILKLDGGRYGLLGFNNMIPVPDEALILYDINAEPDDKYRNLLQHQITFCNRRKADILYHAQQTYLDVISRDNEFLMRISCDFKKLEKACKRYDVNYKPTKKADTE